MVDEIDFVELVRRTQTKKNYQVESVETARAGKRRYKVRNPLDDWFARQIIDGSQYHAGDRFRTLYEKAQTVAAPRYDGSPPPDSFTSKTINNHILEAVGELALLKKHLGELMTVEIIHFAVFGDCIPDTRQERLRYQGRIKMILDRISEIMT